MSVYHIITEQKLLVQLPIEQKLRRQIHKTGRVSVLNQPFFSAYYLAYVAPNIVNTR